MQTSGTNPTLSDGKRKHMVGPKAPMLPKAPVGRPPMPMSGPGMSGGVHHHTPIKGGARIRRALSHLKARGIQK